MYGIEDMYFLFNKCGKYVGFERGYFIMGRFCEYVGYFIVNSLNRCFLIIII